ncbi:MAG TPA: shikimate kinase [Ilumatobacteraceae bacterium]|nr:shikimate kinase [Ilumatobacteraceae bacterium]
MTHLVLVGMMGVGKSTVGRLVAAELDRPLFDSDEMIEERTGRTVREIWATDGEAAFRELETDTLIEALAAPEPSVIAAAGGVVLSDVNRTALRSTDARVVWLLADLAVLVDRVRAGGHRPLLDEDPEGALRRLYDVREPLYHEVADAVVSVDNRSAHDVAKAVLRCCA